ncbi:unnamed protein product [Taenia asiatica]|uniref:Transmembrane protein n=1 Tax=Taenia asiatica TaxID=60517 RepID=A0A0R3W4L4_TAEAS|nr:unnamed protein product [Taenia asiatica]
MAVVFYLPPRNYQFLALQTIVYWAIVAGHMASGYSLLIGIPLLPLLVVQITLLIHIWTSLVTKHQFHPVEPPSVPSASQSSKIFHMEKGEIDGLDVTPNLLDYYSEREVSHGSVHLDTLRHDRMSTINLAIYWRVSRILPTTIERITVPSRPSPHRFSDSEV